MQRLEELDTEILIESIQERFVLEGIPEEYLKFLGNIRVLPERKKFWRALRNETCESVLAVLCAISGSIYDLVKRDRVQFFTTDSSKSMDESWDDLFEVARMIICPKGAA